MTTNNNNTTISSAGASVGDTIRTIARTQDDGTIVKTQALVLDVGGENSEQLVRGEIEALPVHDAPAYFVLCKILDMLTEIRDILLA